ncbi:MAG: alpha/beta hydrolase-fold protein [Gemmatales bacterium]|nr:alpha/beta hydrolase-fold protein [Gemmatales bacterium]MDW7994936.1 alpha/beta hydrolase-fold protein [Gemmatales bacterium]
MPRQVGKLILAAIAIICCLAGKEQGERACRGKDVLPDSLQLANHPIKGRILDFTRNHGQDRRIWSYALGSRRDLYVYLPPNYRRSQVYPVIVYLHGMWNDEQEFLSVAHYFDQAIVRGKLPPSIIVAPDGRTDECGGRICPHSFFINGRAGDFQDWLLYDALGFVASRFPIMPDKDQHAVIGVSLGGFGAYNLAIKHQDKFRFVAGILAPLNVRWMSERGDPRACFDPFNWGWRNSLLDGQEVLACLAHGLIKIRVAEVYHPVFGDDCYAIVCASMENPVELLDRFRVQHGQLEMFVGYAGKDEFNFNAQAESFIYYARSRGLRPRVHVDVIGTHNDATVQRILPVCIEWLGERMRAYGVICEVQPGSGSASDAVSCPQEPRESAAPAEQPSKDLPLPAPTPVPTGPRLPEPEQLQLPAVSPTSDAAKNPVGSPGSSRRSGRWYRNMPK